MQPIDWKPLLDMLAALWNGGLNIIVYTVLFNLVIGLAAALKTGVFNLSKVAEFLVRKIAPYTLVYAIAVLMGDAVNQTWLAPVALAAIMAALAGDLLDSLVALGLPLPEGAKNLIVKK